MIKKTNFSIQISHKYNFSWEMIKNDDFVRAFISKLLTTIEHYWTLFIDHYWTLFKTLLTTIDNYSKHYWPTLLNTIDHYSKHYWPLLNTIEHYSKHYWALLNTIDHYWALFYPTKGFHDRVSNIEARSEGYISICNSPH